MNCIFVNITDKEGLELRKLKLLEHISYTELLIPLSLLNKRVFENGESIIGKIKSHFFDKKLLSKIKHKDKFTLYVLPQVLEKADEKSALSSIKLYIQSVFKTIDVNSYNYTGCIKENMDKYLLEALNKTKLEKASTRLLLVYSKLDNVDFIVLQHLISEYKTVDILSVDNKNEQVKSKIDKINAEYGSSICIKNKITKQEIKTSPYDICVYMEKSDFKISGTHKIHLWDNDSDKFDKTALLLNEMGLLNNVNRDYFSYMTKNYGRLNVISILYKTTLDNK